jgi:hypothetical protein
MDNRCPRKLNCLPDSWCALAVQRLKAQRHAGRELTEEEESKLPGCPWAVSHQMANYCFFKLMADQMPDLRELSTMEIAHFNNVSVDTVNKTEKQALKKIRKSSTFKDIEDLEGIDGMTE